MPLSAIVANHGAADTSPGDVDAPSSGRLAELVFQSAFLRSDGWPDRQLKSVRTQGRASAVVEGEEEEATRRSGMIEYIIAAIVLGLLPAAIAKTRGQDFFPIALIHAFFVKPGSTSVERFVKGGPPSEAGQKDDLRARMGAWHDQHDRSARRRKKE